MNHSALKAVSIAAVLLIIAGALYFLVVSKATAPTKITPVSAIPSAPVTYACDAGKSLIATFGADSVQLQLSDSRTLMLPQTRSGSGIRYESTTTTTDTVFSGEGANANLMEGTVTTYQNCVAGSTTTSNGMTVFTDQGNSFHFTYPSSVTLSGSSAGYSTDWMNGSQELGLVLAKATLPRTFQPKTNFSEATVLVGTSATPKAVANCAKAPATGGPAVAPVKVTINGTSFTKVSTSDAGAGNLYQTTSYRTVRNNQCYVVEYTIHSSNIGNYSPDQGITAFDAQKVQNVLERIVQSFTFIS
jgi:membrane-bound inhibitor of C-type lysozyme